jgi:polyphosphate kinase 2 (PPK2 family)
MPRMKTKDVIEKAREFSRPFCISDGKKFKLKKFDPAETLGLQSEDKPRAREAPAAGVQALAELQDNLYAQVNWAVLLIFQAMDAAGKAGGFFFISSKDEQKKRHFH